MDFTLEQCREIGKYIGVTRDLLYAYTRYQKSPELCSPETLKDKIVAYFKIPEEVRREIPDFSDKKWQKISTELGEDERTLPCSCS